MPTNEFQTNNAMPAHGATLEQSAVERQVRALQADSAAHTDMLRRTGGRDGDNAVLAAGVLATRAKYLFGQLRARAIGGTVSAVLAEPTYRRDNASLPQAGLIPRHMRRASDVRQRAEREAALAPLPSADIHAAALGEPDSRAPWSLYEIVPSIDFETRDMRRRIERAQDGVQPQPAGRLPALLVLPLLAGLGLCLGNIVLGW